MAAGAVFALLGAGPAVAGPAASTTFVDPYGDNGLYADIGEVRVT